MCVMTDAPKQLLQGLEELPRFESQLSFFPSWLSFLGRLKTLKPMAIFGVQYWFYAQLDKLGRNGRAEPEMSVFAATKLLMSLQKQILRERAASR